MMNGNGSGYGSENHAVHYSVVASAKTARDVACKAYGKVLRKQKDYRRIKVGNIRLVL